MVGGVADIAESLTILFGTAPGERAMRPDYGCDLARFVFRERSLALLQDIRATVVRAIRRWEQRIEVMDCQVAFGGGDTATARVLLTYRIRASQAIAQFEHVLDLDGGAMQAGAVTAR
jgi:hypothetical protein